MPSKSARKRESEALQAMGERLVRLSDAELERLPLAEPLKSAIVDARGITSRSALRRQRQLIGKLMRSADAEAIGAALADIARRSRAEAASFHAAERWRDRIAAEGPPAAAAFAEQTGAPGRELEELARALAGADEARTRQIRRRMFRLVRDALAVTGNEIAEDGDEK